VAWRAAWMKLPAADGADLQQAATKHARQRLLLAHHATRHSRRRETLPPAMPPLFLQSTSMFLSFQLSGSFSHPLHYHLVANLLTS